MLRTGLLAIGIAALLPVAAAAAGAVIPDAFRGNWAPALKDCADPDGVDTLTIERGAFNFYEARSATDDFQVEIMSPRRLRVRTMVDGEGKRSAVVMNFEISSDGQALTWSGYGRNPQASEFYVRCPS